MKTPRSDSAFFRKRVAVTRAATLLVDVSAEIMREVESLDTSDEASFRSTLGSIRAAERVVHDMLYNLALLRGVREL